MKARTRTGWALALAAMLLAAGMAPSRMPVIPEANWAHAEEVRTEVYAMPSNRPPAGQALRTTEDFHASCARIAADTNEAGAMKYDLRAVSDGAGPVTFEWSCSVGGAPAKLVQRSERLDGRDSFELSKRADAYLVPYAEHTFTVKATDALGREAEARIVVSTVPERAVGLGAALLPLEGEALQACGFFLTALLVFVLVFIAALVHRMHAERREAHHGSIE